MQDKPYGSFCYLSYQPDVSICEVHDSKPVALIGDVIPHLFCDHTISAHKLVEDTVYDHCEVIEGIIILTACLTIVVIAILIKLRPHICGCWVELGSLVELLELLYEWISFIFWKQGFSS